MSDEAPHNPYVPVDEPDPEHPRPETAGSHEAQSPINKDEIDLESSPLTAPPPSGTPVATDDPDAPVLPVIEAEPIDEKADATAEEPSEPEAAVTEEPTQIYTPPIAAFDPPPPPPPIAPIAPISEEPQPLPLDSNTEGADKVARIIAGVGAAIAVIVLILLLAGVPSHKITSSDISNNAVTGPKIAPNAVGTENLAPGTINAGPRGPAGPTGPAGPAGAAGARGPAGTSGLQIQQVVKTSGSDDSTPKSTVASCPSGQVISSGGASISGTPDVVKNIVLQSSAPTVDSKTSWTATAVDLSDTASGSWQLTVTINCVQEATSDTTPAQSSQSQGKDNSSTGSSAGPTSK